MVLNLQTRLTAALLTVTALFAVTALLTLVAIRQIDDHSRRMVDEHYPTAVTIMDTEIFFYQMRQKVFSPPVGTDRDKLVTSLQEQLRRKREEIGRLPLAEGSRARIDRLLIAAGEKLAMPVLLQGKPGEAMEAADGAIEPVLARARIVTLRLVTRLGVSIARRSELQLALFPCPPATSRRRITLVATHP